MKSRVPFVLVLILSVSLACRKSEDKSDETSSGPDGTTDGDGNGSDGTTDGGAGGGVVLSGQVAVNSGVTPDSAVAFPVNGGEFRKETLATLTTDAIMAGQVALQIGGDGAGLNLDCAPENTMCGGGGGGGGGGGSGQAESHVVVLFNESADKFAEADSFRYVNLDTGGETEAVNILTSELKSDSLDLGTLSGEGDLTGSQPATADTFESPQSVIQELAKTDDSVRKIKNAYMNTTIDQSTKKITQYVETTPGFVWQGYATRYVGASLDVPAEPKYEGFLLYFNAEHPDLTIASLCQTTTGKLKFLPPAPFDSFGSTITEINNDGMGAPSQANTNGTTQSCMKDSAATNAGGYGMYVSGGNVGETGNQGVGWNWAGGTSSGLGGPIPSGTWTMTFDGDTIAKFDLAAAYPFDADGKPLFYVPSIRISVDPTSKVIQKVELAFFLWDRASSSYKPVTDLTAFGRVVRQLTVGFFDMSRTGPRAEQTTGLPQPQSGHVFTASKTTQASNNGWTYDWRLDHDFMNGDPDADGGSGTQPTAETVAINYKMYDTAYSFGFNLPRCRCTQTGPNWSAEKSGGGAPTGLTSSYTTSAECEAAIYTQIATGTSDCR